MKIIWIRKAPCGERLTECIGMGWPVCQTCWIPAKGSGDATD